MLITTKAVSPPRKITADRTAPLAGLNHYMPVQELAAKGHAIRLDNWTCRPQGLSVRRGWKARDVLKAPVRSLLAYPGRIFGKEDADWMGVMVPNAGGLHLVAFAPGKAPITFDGRDWRATAITGCDPTKLINPVRHARRIFAIVEGTLEARYLGLDAIGGPSWLLPWTGLFKRGGHLVALGIWTGDGSEDSVGDKLCAITSEGEIAIFAGSDPDNAATWKLVGVWHIGVPVGPRCFAQVGGKLACLTTSGLLSVPDTLSTEEAARKRCSISTNINIPATATQVIESAAAEVLMVHCCLGPIERDAQYVRDPITKGWSRWTGFGATCWLETNDGLFFGREDGTVAEYGGLEDNARDKPFLGKPIPTVMIDGPALYGRNGTKIFSRAKPLWNIAQPYLARIEMLVDYRDEPNAWNAARIDCPHWFWEDIDYDRMPEHWERVSSPRLGQWRGIHGRGQVASMMLGAKFLGVDSLYMGHSTEYTAGR